MTKGEVRLSSNRSRWAEPCGQLASGRWLALRARSHSAQAVANAGGFRVSLGCTTTSNEEESPLRPTTILRRLLGVTQLNVENGHVAADGPLAVWVRPSWRRSRCGACGRRAPRYDRRPRRRWLHVPWGRTPVWLQYAPWRVSCRQCGVRVERVSWAVGNSAFTAPLEECAKAAKALKGTRFCLLKHPARLKPGEKRRLETLRRQNRALAPAKPAARRSSARRPAAAATPVAETASDATPARKRRPMTAKEKEAVSERMKASWAARRKKAAK